MGLKVGAADVTDVKLGATQVAKVMLGSEQVWPVAHPTGRFQVDPGGSPRPSAPGTLYVGHHGVIVTAPHDLDGGDWLTAVQTFLGVSGRAHVDALLDIYDGNGATLITTWTVVSSEPSFIPGSEGGPVLRIQEDGQGHRPDEASVTGIVTLVLRHL